MAHFVYVDNSQLHAAAMKILEGARLLPQGRLDYARLVQLASPEQGPKAARLYGSKGYGKRCWKDARAAGFQTNIFLRSCANQEKEVTCALVADVVADAITVCEPGDHLFIVAGDRNYLPAVQRVRKLGLPVTVLFFGDLADEKLIHAATHFVCLNAHFADLCKPAYDNQAADILEESMEPDEDRVEA